MKKSRLTLKSIFLLSSSSLSLSLLHKARKCWFHSKIGKKFLLVFLLQRLDCHCREVRTCLVMVGCSFTFATGEDRGSGRGGGVGQGLIVEEEGLRVILLFCNFYAIVVCWQLIEPHILDCKTKINLFVCICMHNVIFWTWYFLITLTD